MHFFFRCGDRFTAHQHLDVGQFGIYKSADLAGDGGYYSSFGGFHDVNYSVRSIAHSVMLVNMPGETWPGIRAGDVTGNDGGQHHNWRHHNGAAVDVQAWEDERDALETGDILAFEDTGDYVYVAADCTGAYIPEKLKSWTRQILYMRPSRFVILDRVESTNADYRKTWQLQAAKTPTVDGDTLTITNGDGRLFVQQLLPVDAQVSLASGDAQYQYDGKDYPLDRDPPGPLMECRVQVSPTTPSTVDYFLHVLTATDSTVDEAPGATAQIEGDEIVVSMGASQIRFAKDEVGGSIAPDGDERALADGIVPTE